MQYIVILTLTVGGSNHAYSVNLDGSLSTPPQSNQAFADFPAAYAALSAALGGTLPGEPAGCRVIAVPA